MKNTNYPIQYHLQIHERYDAKQYYDYYDTVYEDYDVVPDTRNVYHIATRYYEQDDIPPICNKTIELPPLTLRTLQNQIIPYWFKYMVAL